MGNAGAAVAGMEKAPNELDESVDGILKQIDEATVATHGGKFVSFDGSEVPW